GQSAAEPGPRVRLQRGPDGPVELAHRGAAGEAVADPREIRSREGAPLDATVGLGGEGGGEEEPEQVHRANVARAPAARARYRWACSSAPSRSTVSATEPPGWGRNSAPSPSCRRPPRARPSPTPCPSCSPSSTP